MDIEARQAMVGSGPSPAELRRAKTLRLAPFLFAAAAGACVVSVLGLGLDRGVDAVLLASLGGTITDHGILLAGISAPISEELASAGLFWGATGFWLYLRRVAPNPLPELRGALVLPLPAWQILCLGTAFALMETLGNWDSPSVLAFPFLVALRGVAHSIFTAIAAAGFWVAFSTRRWWLAPLGIIGAMLTHGTFNVLTQIGMIGLRQFVILGWIAGLGWMAWKIKGSRWDCWPPPRETSRG